MGIFNPQEFLMRAIHVVFLLLLGCPKKDEPVDLEPRSYEVEWPDDEDLDDLPEDTGM
tara:strand:- start:523 stop:696 length:174 start_codon:yes stop_codon:yes gene_type:complete